MKLRKKEYQNKVAQIIEVFNSHNTLPEETKKERIKKAKKNFWYFMDIYLSHYMESKSPKFHKEIISLLEKGNSPLVIGAPRGFSKSTLVSFAYVIWNILREKYLFIVIVSATDSLASDLCEFIQIEFSHNSYLIKDFGKLLSSGTTKDFMVHKTRILSRGRKQALRGFRSREHRPDLIILDDIEKDEEALSPKIVTKALDTITRGIIPSLKPGGKLIVIGTILRRRSVMGTLLLSKEDPWNTWTRKIYKALEYNKKGRETSLWSKRFPLKFLRKQKIIMGISSFNAEYQNMPMDSEISLFKESYIREGNIELNSSKVIYIDPSVDGIKKNDYKAAVLVAKNEENIFEVIDVILIQGSDSIFFEKVISLYQEYSSTIIGTYIESNSFQIYYMRELDNFAKKQGIDLRLCGDKNYQKKELRISRMLPIFETNRIVFNPQVLTSTMGKTLIEQLLYFPSSSVHDDGADALAGAIDILSKINQQIQKHSYQVLPKSVKKWSYHGKSFRAN